MSYQQQELELQVMVGQGQMMEAFEKFYHDDIVMIEPTGQVCEGKNANRKREEEFLGMVQEVHNGGIGKVASNEQNGTTMTESWMDVTFKDGNRMKLEQVSVKQWQGNKVLNERFYYNAP